MVMLASKYKSRLIDLAAVHCTADKCAAKLMTISAWFGVDMHMHMRLFIFEESQQILRFIEIAVLPIIIYYSEAKRDYMWRMHRNLTGWREQHLNENIQCGFMNLSFTSDIKML